MHNISWVQYFWTLREVPHTIPNPLNGIIPNPLNCLSRPSGGLMPHILNATLLDQSDACRVLLRFMELGTNFAAIGHGLDVVLALGKEHCPIRWRKAAVFPNQDGVKKFLRFDVSNAFLKPGICGKLWVVTKLSFERKLPYLLIYNIEILCPYKIAVSGYILFKNLGVDQ